MIQIKRAAEVTGIPEATLRIWERRYGLGASERSESGYRLYTSADIWAIREMQKLIGTGWPVAKAAREVASKKEQRSGAGSETPNLEIKDSLTEATSQFFKAMQDLDSLALSRVLDDVFARTSFEYAIDGWLAPTLMELGTRWQRGLVDIASEHFASHAIVRRISAAFESAGNSHSGPKVIIGAPSGSVHEIGSLAFATAAKRAGMQVIYLGVDVPPESWVDAALKNEAEAIVISVKMSDDLQIANQCIKTIRSQIPNVKILAGGSAAAKATGADLILEGNLTESVRTLTDLLL